MRRDWTKDYQETTGPDGKRSYIYTGDRFELTEVGRHVYASRVTPLLALILGLLVVFGLLNSPGSRAAYVALPWSALCFVVAISLFDAARVLLTKRALTARNHKSSALRLKKTLIWMLVFSALEPACDFLYFLLNGRPVDEYLPIMLSVFILLLCGSAYRLEKAAVWKKIPPEAQKPPA